MESPNNKNQSNNGRATNSQATPPPSATPPTSSTKTTAIETPSQTTTTTTPPQTAAAGALPVTDKSENAASISSQSEDPLRYGWFGFTPQWLQRFNTAFWFMIFVALTNTFFSGTANGLIGAVQSSIETRFQLSSTQSSWIITAYEFGSIPMLLVITYIGSRGVHRPRWVAAAMMGCAVGVFLYGLPHFTTPVYRPAGDGEEDDGLCWIEKNRTEEDVCSDDDADDGGSLSNYLALFVVSRLITGAAGVPLALLGMTYMDDCVLPGKFTMYSAVFAAGGVVGPAMGFIVGGGSLSLFTDWYNVEGEDIGVEPGDPRWVGAWWLGFCFAALFLMILSIPLAGYPKDLPGAAEIRAVKKSEAFDGDADEMPVDPTEIDFSVNMVPRYMKDVFTNWSFLFIAVYICCDMAILSAFTAFGPKYVEIQFSLTPATAGILFGALVVPAGVIGTVTAGVLVERFSLSALQMMKMEAIIGILIVLLGSCLLLTCEQADFAGVSVGYNGSALEDLTDPCNEQCQCAHVTFDPVCSFQNVQYFSPCHAGCEDMIEDTQEFYNCSCIGDPTTDTEEDTAAATSTICSSPDCKTIPVFAVMLFFAMVGLFMAEAMNISLVIRVVPNTHRLFAMMTQSILLRLIGTVPGPLMFGAAFDASCLLWQETCGERGSCFHYDNSRLALLIFLICGSLKVASVISMFLAWFLYKPPKAIVEETQVEADSGSTGSSEEEEGGGGVNRSKSVEADKNGWISQVLHVDELDQVQKPYNRQISEEIVQDFFAGTNVDKLTFSNLAFTEEDLTRPRSTSSFSRDYTKDDVTTYL